MTLGDVEVAVVDRPLMQSGRLARGRSRRDSRIQDDEPVVRVGERVDRDAQLSIAEVKLRLDQSVDGSRLAGLPSTTHPELGPR